VDAVLNNIRVNTDKQLISGNIESVYNPKGPFIIGMDKDEPGLSEEGTGDQEEGEEDSFDELPEADIDIEGEIADVIVDEDTGTITVIDSDGNETEIDPETADENEDGDIVIEDDEGNVWVVGDEGNVSKGDSGDGNAPDGSTEERNLTGLDSLVYEVIVQRIESNEAVIDSLKEKMQPIIEEIEGVIERENFYPPRIKGENDELIKEGISLHMAIVSKPENVKERLSPSVKSIDEFRNSLIALDIPIQELKPVIELLNEIKEGVAFEEFMVYIKSNNTLPDNTTDRTQFIEELLDKRISENEE
jgi:hypothetical protein